MSSPLRLEQATVRLRPRGHFEAIDLGLEWVRRHPGRLYGAWLVTALPIALLSVLLFWSVPWLATLVLWWFKPLYERLPMWLLSRGLFGPMPSVREAWQAKREALQPGMASLLTWRRLAPARSFLAPVFVLERPDASVRRSRELVLLRSASSPAFWLTILGWHVEGFLLFGGFVLIALLLPQGVDADIFSLLVEQSGPLSWVVFALMFGSMAVLGPVYAAGGFALYINRRVALEGWDIELGFRRLASRVEKVAEQSRPPGQGSVSTTALLVLVAVLVGLPPTPALADDRREESRQAIDAVLDDPEFGGVETFRCPAFLCEKGDDEDVEDEPDLDGVRSLFQAIAAMAEVLMWALLAIVIGWVLWRARLLNWFASKAEDNSERVTVVMGMSVDPDSLPADPPREALALWQAGQRRGAASLLYRATLSLLITAHQARFANGDTEGDCLRKVRGVAPRKSVDYLARLTGLWQRVAYAHVRPQDVEFETLCEQWSGAMRPTEPRASEISV